MTDRRLHRLAGILLALLLTVFATAQQTNGAEPLPQPLAGWEADLQRIEKSLTRALADDEALVRLREQLETVRKKTASYVSRLQEQYATVDTQLKKLGPAPKPEEQPESDAAAKVRQELDARAAELDGAIRTAEVLQTRAIQLSGNVQERRRKLFSRQLLKRVQSPLSPALWTRVADDTRTVLRGLGFLVTDWWAGISRAGLVFALLAAAVTIWGVLAALSSTLVARYRLSGAEEVPPFLQRAGSAAGATLARAAPPIVAAGSLVLALWLLDMLPGSTASLALSALTAFSAVMALMALVKTVLAPNQPRWRILPVTDRDARRLRWLAWGVAIIYGLDLFLASLNTILVSPIPLTVAQSFVTTVAVALLLAAMLRVPVGRADEKAPRSESALLGLLRGLLWLLVITILCAAALGYIALARFVITQIVVTGSIIILVWLLHVTIDEFTASLADPERKAGRWLAANFQIPAQRHAQVGIIASFVLHLLLLLVVVPVLALQWGFDWEDLRFWISKAVFGFRVGNWRISLATIFVAVLLFVALIAASRLFQRWLDTRVLARAQFDQGARSAIRTTVGYLGVAVAALIAVSYAGVDFSNVAIVAGALSVGIGFGLQSIVNNFVSGLILLAERRISVGDWIIVGAEEGFVRRISVRATEIETFDRNFVIIPNSELMTNSVKNWTFLHRRARVTIEVGVSYGSDPEQVRDLMTRIANEHPATIDHDKTRVWFDEFGDSALIFRLKAFVGDVSNLLDTRSELRYAIMREFRKAGIEIPYPQRDIHLKDIDRLEAALTGKKAPRKAAAGPRARRSRTSKTS